MRDKQENTFRSLKRKEHDLELSRNETAKNLKGSKGKIHAKDAE